MLCMSMSMLMWLEWPRYQKTIPCWLDFVIYPLIDSTAAMHIMSVMTILLTTMLTMLTMFLPKSFKPFKPSIFSQEVSVALNRGEELKKLKERLSAAKLIMEKDPSAKPWMLSRF